jgi:tetratricopeptide (TPR) repeat protein
MDSYPNTSNAHPSEGNPEFSAGVEAGLVGAVLILVEMLIQNFIAPPALGLVLGLIRICIWIGVGALAVHWLKGKGSIARTDQTKASIIAGLITALVTSVLLVIFRYIQSKTLDDILIPPGIPIDLYNEFIEVYTEFFNLALGISLVCCVGLPTIILGTAFSFGGSVLMRVFIGSSTQAPYEQQVPFQPYPGQPVHEPAYPVQLAPPERLQDFLSLEGLPLELHTSVAAYKRGELANARPAFVRFLRENPKHAYAWLWLSVMIDDPDRQLECVRRALALEPGNETAQRMLEFLQGSSF